MSLKEPKELKKNMEKAHFSAVKWLERYVGLQNAY